MSDNLTLYVALTRAQFNEMDATGGTNPDPYSNRFGLRKTPAEAIERSYYFMNWSGSACWEMLTSKKEFLVLKVVLTPLGLMRLIQNETLLIKKPGEYQLHGRISQVMADGEVRIGTEVFEVI